jgi:long-chain acyl-CoA synthetase
MFIGVPRIFNRYYDSIRAGFDSAQGPKKLLIQWALESKRKSLAQGRYLSFWDLFVFRAVAKQALGGNVRFIATGSAPISPDLLELFRMCFSCAIIEGYGMTEVLVVSGTPHRDTSKRSHVGAPWDSVEIKLVDVPDMEYLTSDQPFARGEICFRGPMVMSEYFNDPVRTSDALDQDGWLHSGDIGCWLEDGHLRILDRKKNIFKLSNGEYVQPEKLEQLYVQSKYVAQIYVEGSSLAAHLVAIVVPDPMYLADLAADAAVAPEALLTSADAAKAIVRDLDRVLAANALNPYERIAAVHISPLEFPAHLLTPTFKLKRNVARHHFDQQITALLESL